MAEEFEVRGLHEDRLDEAAEKEPTGMAGQLAVMTAILATVGAMFSYMAGATQADAGLFKNDAAIKKQKRRINGGCTNQKAESKTWLNWESD